MSRAEARRGLVLQAVETIKRVGQDDYHVFVVSGLPRVGSVEVWSRHESQAIERVIEVSMKVGAVVTFVSTADGLRFVIGQEQMAEYRFYSSHCPRLPPTP
jgi:hypothetical protein